MLTRFLQQTDLGDLATLASPAVFDVVSVPAVLRRARSVLKESRRTWPERRGSLRARFEPMISLEPLPGAPLSAAPQAARADLGHRILTIYFAQLFSDAPTALDLRSRAWAVRDAALHWDPASTTVTWDPTFIAAMRDIYLGFYDSDDALFIRSLGRLDLDGAADLFRQHIGDGEPTALRFSRSTFVQSFGRIFEHCKAAGIRLHPDFVLLGAYLGGLYDALDDLGVPLDVVAAFDAGARGEPSTA